MKEIRAEVEKVIEYFLAGNPYNLSEPSQIRIDQAEEEIKKIVLGWVGDDAKDAKDAYQCPCPKYNKALAELRKKIEGEL